MSKNSPLQTYRASIEWLESVKRRRKAKRNFHEKYEPTTNKHRSKPNHRRGMRKVWK